MVMSVYCIYNSDLDSYLTPLMMSKNDDEFRWSFTFQSHTQLFIGSDIDYIESDRQSSVIDLHQQRILNGCLRFITGCSIEEAITEMEYLPRLSYVLVSARVPDGVPDFRFVSPFCCGLWY